jgi:cytochrome oxidase Cu insertion factor (SCO1/SenC/PrrC family)
MLSASFVVCLLAPQHSGASLWAASRSAASGALPLLWQIDADLAFSPTIPDVHIYDQHGRSLRFRSDLLNGKTVAINFIFTSCTTTCPPLTTAMRAIQRELADRVGRDIWLISVSVDPAVDRPEPRLDLCHRKQGRHRSPAEGIRKLRRRHRRPFDHDADWQ